MKRRRRVKTGVVESFFSSVKDSVALSPHKQAVIGQAPHPNKSQQKLEPTTCVAAKDKIQPLPLPSAAFDLTIDKTIIRPALFTFLFKNKTNQNKNNLQPWGNKNVNIDFQVYIGFHFPWAKRSKGLVGSCSDCRLHLCCCFVFLLLRFSISGNTITAVYKHKQFLLCSLQTFCVFGANRER